MSKPRTLRKPHSIVLAVACWTFLGALVYAQWTPLPVEDDPLVRMPGTQPGQVTVEAPGRCTNCHGDYGGGLAEPATQWMGSMMAQSARDFLFWSCMTVAAQDSLWALGRPNATDICERCHFPKGWLEGRSDPTNATLMTGADFDGLSCDVCHSMVDPFYETTHDGTREGSDWLNYWDETDASSTPSSTAADDTYAQDITDMSVVTLYNGNPFFVGNLPQDPNYTEAASGHMFVGGTRDKRASFTDASARHGIFYSRFHKSKYFCGTCHDVSNPALANLAFNGTLPGDGTTILPTEQNAPGFYYHVERTFSEFILSDYGLQGGTPGIGPYDPSVFVTSDPNNWIRTCQDCHMPDVLGQKACTQNDGVIRPGDSTEHPNSGVPQHDLTGGNAWVSYVLASSVSGSPNYDATNDALLNQGPAVLTLDLTQGVGLDPVNLLAGVQRAKDNLGRAATLQNLTYDSATGQMTFRVRNNTAHKLISGFPEGRRMFANIKAYYGPTLIYEVNPYDPNVGTLKGLPGSTSSPPLGPDEAYEDRLVWEAHTSSTLTGETETFHFVLATGRYKDNRIPPKGFRIAEATARFSDPWWHGASDPAYFTAAEYAGGYDDVEVTIGAGADLVEVRLYYQTTSREYVEFLRDEINGTASTLSSPTPSGLPDAYVVQTDPWFDQLKAWGDTLWQLWDHNKNVPGAAPYLMAADSVAGGGPVGAGQIPDAHSVPGTPLSIALEPTGDVTLSWGTSCLTGDTDYEVYEGTAGTYTSHAPITCTTGGATTYTFAPTGGATYYLVVPRTGSREGSYGQDSTGAERPPSASQCLPQQFAGC